MNTKQIAERLRVLVNTCGKSGMVDADRITISAAADLLERMAWQPMETAPKDGTKLAILFRHQNYQYADEEYRGDWQQICQAYWTDFNGGGWVWHGIAGTPVCWMHWPDPPSE